MGAGYSRELVENFDKGYNQSMDKKYLPFLMIMGLKTRPASVYLAVLKLKDAGVQEISEKAGVKRTTVYTIASDLETRGFIYRRKNKNNISFGAYTPKVIIERLKNGVGVFEKNFEDLPRLEHKVSPKTKILVFENTEGFKKIWETLFRSGVKEYLIITDPREMLGFVEKGYITGKIIKEKNWLGIKSRQIIASSEYAKEIVAKDAKENRISKILPHIYKLPFTVIIFGGFTALISPLLENTILLIESKDFAKTQRSIFEALWESKIIIK